MVATGTYIVLFTDTAKTYFKGTFIKASNSHLAGR